MKARRILGVRGEPFLRCFVVVVGMVASVFAGLPRPCCIFYGQAKDEYGWPYTRDAEVIMRVNGAELKRHRIDGSVSPGVNFLFRVPIDNGSGGVYAQRAARSGDAVSFAVVAGGEERTILETNLVMSVGDPGEILSINVTAGNDTDNDRLPDAWEEWIVSWSTDPAVRFITDVDGADDFDGDGMSNRDEYQAGTDPTWDADYFYIEDIECAASKRLRIVCLTVPGKVYRLDARLNLTGSVWQPAPCARSETAPLTDGPIEGTGDFISLYIDTQSAGGRFYRLRVE